ncbi:cytochrome P450 [Actinomadura welshii]|uniref:cytochrome P450 n=1 Tax=Actinomadura welshii TaxID=3103817 RepID=UPI0003AD6F0B|nr:cytochrome P450 [Actinomadura madurae]
MAFGQISGWVEETVRLEAPTQADGRKVTEQFTLHGVTTPAKARMLLVGSADRDPRVLDEPDRFDLGRDSAAKISFGSGRHHCIGAHLSRLEVRVALEELTARVSVYSINETGARRINSPYGRGFTSLPTAVTPRRV